MGVSGLYKGRPHVVLFLGEINNTNIFIVNGKLVGYNIKRISNFVIFSNIMKKKY